MGLIGKNNLRHLANRYQVRVMGLAGMEAVIVGNGYSIGAGCDMIIGAGVVMAGGIIDMGIGISCCDR